MTDLERPVKLWHLIATAVLSAVGTVFLAGYTWASRDARLGALEDKVERIPRMERMVQRIGDKIGVNWDGID